jgi:hypothetical protein
VLEKGILMPSFRHVENVHIVGTQSHCEYWKILYCRKGVVGNYSCGKDDIVSNPKEAKI